MPKWNLKIAILFKVSTMILLAESCNVTFYATGPAHKRSGVITSLGYPKPYPAGVNCEFHFINSRESRLRLNFLDFDLRDAVPDTGGQCAYDFVDVFLIDGENSPMKMMQRKCGKAAPQQLLTSASHIIVYFKSRSESNDEFSGFRAEFSFTNDSTIAPPSTLDNVGDSVCGVTRLRGTGGVLSSPSLPSLRDVTARQRLLALTGGMINCTWTIRISEGDQILINFLSINLGPSEVVCRDSYLLMYNSVVDFERTGSLEKICGRLSLYPGKSKEYVSNGPWLTIRYIYKFPKLPQSAPSDNSQALPGPGLVSESTLSPTVASNVYYEPSFRLVWTAVWNIKQGEECPGFECSGRQSCLDSGKVVCHKTPRYCIHPTLRCDGIPHCGPQDTSDEETCQLPLILSGVAAGVGILLTLIATVAIVVWRVRTPNLRRTKAKPVPRPPTRTVKPGTPPNLSRMLERLADKKNATAEYSAVITNKNLVNTRGILASLSQQQDGNKTAAGSDTTEKRPILIKPSIVVNRNAGLVSVRFAAATPPDETTPSVEPLVQPSSLPCTSPAVEDRHPLPTSVSAYENPLQVERSPTAMTLTSEPESGSICFPPPPTSEEMGMFAGTPPIPITPPAENRKLSTGSSGSARACQRMPPPPSNLPLNVNYATSTFSSNYATQPRPTRIDAKEIAKLVRDNSVPPHQPVAFRPEQSLSPKKQFTRTPFAMSSSTEFQWELRMPGSHVGGSDRLTTVNLPSASTFIPSSKTLTTTSPVPLSSQTPDSLADSSTVDCSSSRRRSSSSHRKTVPSDSRQTTMQTTV